MAKKMLIDATHSEETRVVVVDGNKVEEFDFETVNKRQLAGNIYLAKVTRVEPSLQAAFVDYGGNRHGFLAFAEIHPDYYQIPMADRKALLDEDRAQARAEDEDEASKEKDSGSRQSNNRRRTRSPRAEASKSRDAVKTAEVSGMDIVDLDGDNSAPVALQADVSAAQQPFTESSAVADTLPVAEAAPAVETAETAATHTVQGVVQADGSDDDDRDDDSGDDAIDSDDDDSDGDENGDENGDDDAAGHDDGKSKTYTTHDGEEEIESVADEDVTEEIRAPRRPRARRYKIQEVVKVRQILLVQVVKEERGNKGAALTTYLSLAGRYCVLMPNTARGGGISRKITLASDRKKLKEIASEIVVPEGAGLIIRTAGAKRSKPEIRRDYEYLMRLWEQVRELTMRSVAPSAIYEEGNLIKRSIRDLYSREIDEILVEGAEGYRIAKDFMRMIMPSHAKAVQPYNDPTPLFARFQVESYLAGMFNPTVQLRSGGYIVIGITEALVAIDVNSGRATKEGSIEDTATKTNLEAAEEVARQLRLRDLAGLIVIDFIDMEDRRNNAAVEKRLKDKLKTDRARIQVGRISGFGLMEMSRQRLRPGMLESTTQPCAHCHGTGLIRSDDSMALQILRALEEEGTRKRSKEVLLRAPVAVVNFLLNEKREHIALIEARYGMSVRVEADPSLISPDFTLEKFKTATRAITEISSAISGSSAFMGAVVDDIEDPDIPDEEAEDEATEAASVAIADSARAADAGDGDGSGRKKRRRRRRRRGGNNGSGDENGENGSDDDSDEIDGEDDAAEGNANAVEAGSAAGDKTPEAVTAPEEEAKPAAKPRRTRSRKAKATPEEAADKSAGKTAEKPTEPAAEAGGEEAAVKPKAKPRTRKPRVSKAAAAAAAAAEAEAAASEDAPAATAETTPPVPVVENTAEFAAEAVVPVEVPVAETIAETGAQAPAAESAVLLADPGDAPDAADGLKVDPGQIEADAAGATAESDAETTPEDKPRRRGWWNLGR